MPTNDSERFDGKKDGSERAVVGGIVLWVVVAVTAITYRPELMETLIFESNPLTLAGDLLISIGGCWASIKGLVLATRRLRSPETTELTEWENAN